MGNIQAVINLPEELFLSLSASNKNPNGTISHKKIFYFINTQVFTYFF